jgi:hypothetical protein
VPPTTRTLVVGPCTTAEAREDVVDRRRGALVLLLAFVACTGVSILLSGLRPATDPALVPWLVQVVGHLCGLAGGVLLLAPREGDPAAARDRRIGAVVMPALVALVLIDALALSNDSAGGNIGAGLVRLVLLVVIGVATDRLARDVAAARRRR